MFTSLGGLKDVVPIVEQLTRLPGRALVQFCSVLSFTLTVLGYFAVKNSATAAGAVPLIVGICCMLVTAFFAYRRHQLEKAVNQWLDDQESTIDSDSSTESVDYSAMFNGQAQSESTDVVILNEDGTPYSSNGTSSSDNTRASAAADTRARRLHDAQMESAQRRDTWMPGVEAAQRAAIAAAGGTVNAPYLKPDLRVTIVSALLALAVIPIAVLFSIVALFILV
jgi:hypothetical protein